MSELTKYKVVVNGTLMPNEDRDEVIKALVLLFHSTPEKMGELLNDKAIALKKEYKRDEAEKICRAIRNAGAQCRLRPIKKKKLEVLDDDYSSLSLSEQQSGFFCPGCHKECDSSWESCEYCGHTFVRKEADSGFSFSVGEESEVSDDHENDSAPLPRRKEIIRFVGPNSDYYLGKFAKFGNISGPKFALSWHWPALTVFFFWALYRKMWLWAIANQVSTILLMLFTKPSFLWLIFALAWPLCANFLYYKHVANHINRLKADDTREEKESYLLKTGGASKPALWAGIILTFTLSMLVSNKMATQFLEVYNSQHGSQQSGDITQMRGDGSVLESVEGESREFAETSKALNALATSVKIIIGVGNEELIATTVDSLLQKSDNEEIRDAWGNPIYVEQDSGHIVFSSSGPDGVENTDDDILQFVMY